MADYSLKMTPVQFTEKVIEIYRKARHPSYYHPKIKRGRSHIVSGQVEDLLAAYLGFNLISDYDIYVDQPISVEGTKKALYPDIILSEKGTLKNFIDVKMDLGWNRDGFTEFCLQKNDLVQNLKSQKYKLKDGLTKEIIAGEISIDLKYHIVIVSDKNISKNKFVRNIDETSNLNNLNVYSLTSEKHPNTYEDVRTILNLIRINHDQFEFLLESL